MSTRERQQKSKAKKSRTTQAGSRSKSRSQSGVKKGAKSKNSASGSSKSRSSEAELVEKIRDDIWPTERGVLFRPERLRYVRKMIKPSGCVFCQALASGPSSESLLLYAGDRAMVVINKYPYNAGHLLILPTRHCGDLLELSEEENAEIQSLLRRSVRALKEVYSPSGFNVGLNLGTASGAGIPEHLHYHIVPRWAGDANFFALIAETKVVVETLEETHRRLLPYFEAIS